MKTAIEMKAVNSSMVNRLGYDEASRELHVEFKSGSVYKYTNVDSSVYEVIVKSESIGKAINSELKDKYEYIKS